jgi:hypothetical protein
MRLNRAASTCSRACNPLSQSHDYKKQAHGTTHVIRKTDSYKMPPLRPIASQLGGLLMVGHLNACLISLDLDFGWLKSYE